MSLPAAKALPPAPRSTSTFTDLSLPKIGAHFGGRDHTTVMYAERKINQLLAERRSVFNQVSELTNRVKMQARQA
jgi:chromosomal replication initiator protein